MFICLVFFLHAEKKINILNAKARSLSIEIWPTRGRVRGREVNETLIERRNEPNTPDNDHYIMIFSDWLSPWMCEMACTVKRDVRWISTVFVWATLNFVGSLDRVLNFKENEINEQLKFWPFFFSTGSTTCSCSDLNRFRCNCYPRRKTNPNR